MQSIIEQIEEEGLCEIKSNAMDNCRELLIVFEFLDGCH